MVTNAGRPSLRAGELGDTRSLWGSSSGGRSTRSPRIRLLRARLRLPAINLARGSDVPIPTASPAATSTGGATRVQRHGVPSTIDLSAAVRTVHDTVA